MPMHRKNSCKGETPGLMGAKWFTHNVIRQRRRNALATQSRRKNRK